MAKLAKASHSAKVATQPRAVHWSCSLAVLVALLLFACKVQGQEGYTLQGTVVDSLGGAIAGAKIRTVGAPYGTQSNEEGAFWWYLPSQETSVLTVSKTGYNTVRIELNGQAGDTLRRTIRLYRGSDTLVTVADVWVTGQRRPPAMQRLTSLEFDRLQGTMGGVEMVLKTMPGVHMASELSNQYSVRGGSFDENLVYIDGIEVMRPQLLRTGQQEGLSLLNPDMTAAIEFSAGGFPAQYGERMSSVVNVRYREPHSHALKLQASLLESRLYWQGASDTGGWSGMIGARYKSNKLLIGTTDTKGDYRPLFFDLQGKVIWHPRKELKLTMLGIWNQNEYQFKPLHKQTQVGTLTEAFQQLDVYYEGQEKDRQRTLLGALSLNWQIDPRWCLESQLGFTYHQAREAFDILAEYWLSDLRASNAPSGLHDSTANVGIGGFLNHARNELTALTGTLQCQAQCQLGAHGFLFGISVNPRWLRSQQSEWHLVDSAGYSLPTTSAALPVQGRLHGQQALPMVQYAAFAQGTLEFEQASGTWRCLIGLRYSAMNLFWHSRISPRVSLEFTPSAAPLLKAYAAGGLYYQYAFYREMLDRAGQLHPRLKPQMAIHSVIGTQYSFMLWSRLFKVQVELYYKWLYGQIPYTVDNVRLCYEALNAGEGYARGIDVKLNGELVPGAESWLSLSLLQAQMRLTQELPDAERMPRESGYFPMPHDQLFSVGLYLRDYLPRMPSCQVLLSANYATGLPYSTPSGRYGDFARMPSYQRIDIGFSYIFKDDFQSLQFLRRFQWLRELSLSIEVLNLFNTHNTISYLWLRVPGEENGQSQLAVPNYLTARCVNIMLRARF